MPYVVNETCIKCKLMDCVDVCPVDCFYEGENMLVINPDECIDCGVCVPECPVDAIITDTEDTDQRWFKINQEYADIWPILLRKMIMLFRKMQKIMPEFQISLTNISLRNLE